LNNLKNKYPEIDLHSFEVYFNKENQKLWENIAKAYGTTTSGVPMTFIGDKVFIGFAEGNNKIYDSSNKAYIGYSGVIEETIKEYINSGGAECPSSQPTNSSSSQPKNWGYQTTFTNFMYIVGIIVIASITYILWKKFKR
jgi:hypothetical protein